MPSKDIRLSEFFKNGLYFSCEKCGACCKGLNNGEVYLYKNDIEKLVEYLNKQGEHYTQKSFAKKYLKLIRTSFYWKEEGKTKGKNYYFFALGFKFTGNDEHCEFIDKNDLCSVHIARPFQCRAYPIGWNILIKNMRNFRKYSKECPALRNSLEKKGELYKPEQILEWAKKEYELEKGFFIEMKKNNFDIFKTYKFLPKDISR
ncbi:MAG: YkgJ family cysteine cluster protein [Candidatus Lokiarchaeota archaeon]|nr:YkgJ family cysteine cluster protein [Candidatus Lokiarchaeota archaeon]